MTAGYLLKKTLIVIHRYAGIPLSVMIIVWFVSGIVMMYAGGMPELSANARLDKLPPLDLDAVELTPAEAAERLGGRGITSPTLTTVLERPAYRFARGFGGAVTIFADTGERMPELTIDAARGVAARFAEVPEDRVRFVETVENVDQWTLTQRNTLPLHRFDVDDGTGARVYVSPQSGRVELVTTTRTRALAWAGTIPHWLYFAPLRTKPLWAKVVVWTSAAACVLAVIGLVIGVWQLRLNRAPKVSLIPYRGWMRWHHVLGLFFGVFALTWAFSGLLSMEPFAWTQATSDLNVRRDVFTGGPVQLDRYRPFDARAWDGVLGDRVLKEVEFTRIRGDHYYAARYTRAPDAKGAGAEGRRERLHQPYGVTGRNERGRLLIAADTLRSRTEPFAADGLLATLRDAVTDAAIVESAVLDDYDSFYYSRGRQAPLPVLRVKFDDAMATWVYVDLATAQPVAQVHRLNRVERWLYNGLHSLDFSFWYDKRPLWDIGMIVLSLGALATTAIGLYLGLQRIRRGTLRLLRRGAVTNPRPSFDNDGPVEGGDFRA